MKLLKTAFRSLGKFRLYTVVNIIGLAVSLACVILIARYVHQETTVNHFAKDLDRTYMMFYQDQKGRSRYGGAYNPNNDKDYTDPHTDPSVEAVTSFVPFDKDFIVLGEHTFDVKLIAADSVFLQILPYPVLYGSSKLVSPQDAILTEEFAQKLFGNTNPVGKTFTYSSGDVLKVSGVIRKPVFKSFLQFDLLVNRLMKPNGFWARSQHDLVLLYSGADVEDFNKRNGEFKHYSHFRELLVRYQLFALKDVYFDRSNFLYEESNDSVFVLGNKASIKVVFIVGILILLIGLFNFVNIYTVVALRRGREFGIKKVFGANKTQLFLQLYMENLFMAVIAVFLAWALIELSDVFLTNQLGIAVQGDQRFDLWLSCLILLVLPFITTLYPFLRYAFSTPVTSLRSVNVGGVSLVSRSAFLFLQYVITFALLVTALFFMKQLRFMLDADPGYDTKNVIICKLLYDNHFNDIKSNEEYEVSHHKMKQNEELIRRKLNESPLFSNWLLGEPPYNLKASTPVARSGREDYKEVAIEWFSNHYMRMFGLQLLEGRFWNDSIDIWGQYKCIINESAKELLEITDIHSQSLQTGERIWFSSLEGDMKQNPPYEIVGVIKDFQTGHLSQKTVPLMISYEEDIEYDADFLYGPLMAKIIPGREKEAVAYLRDIFTEINGDAEFTYSFLEDDIAALYKDDKRVSRVYTTFAVIAILVSCLGLFALSLFDIRQRYREIALRKVNGATTKDVLRLLLKKYIWLLAGAFVVAVPVSYLFINKYLEGFAHKAPVSWWLFAVSAVVVAGVSLLTLVWQVKKAVRIDPARVLAMDN